MKKINLTHWSYFEPWDSYRNYVVAKEHCGLTEKDDGNFDTFTNFAQNDQALYALHAYMMYLKFGFGRATQDAGIDIRRGSMTRDQAINLVQMYDNAYPYELIDTYLDYFKMKKDEFDSVLDNFVNKDSNKNITSIEFLQLSIIQKSLRFMRVFLKPEQSIYYPSGNIVYSIQLMKRISKSTPTLFLR